MAENSAHSPQIPTRRRRGLPLLVGLVLVCLVILATLWISINRLDRPLKPAFIGDSSRLKQTVIVPTLDTPMPKGKNVIWCSSFQIAWNHLKSDIIKAPIQLHGAQDVAGRLNVAKESEADLPKDSYYATAGFVNDGIVQKIQQEMAKRFPAVPPPTFQTAQMSGAIVSYAYLQANAKFNLPFFAIPKKVQFTDSAGKRIDITAFGIKKEDEYRYYQLRAQVQVLYNDQRRFGRQQGECVIDLCRDLPTMVVLASVKPKGNLSETMQYVETVVAKQFKEEGTAGNYGELGPDSALTVPNIYWSIDHHYRDLEGKTLQTNTRSNSLIDAFQTIHFRLDRNGAELKSEAKLEVNSISPDYIFDHPFLLYMKQRNAARPFFVMWVDNAELLDKR